MTVAKTGSSNKGRQRYLVQFYKDKKEQGKWTEMIVAENKMSTHK